LTHDSAYVKQLPYFKAPAKSTLWRHLE